MVKLSVVLATRNEEANIADCLKSVESIADECVVVDESSTDKTREIAKELGAKVYKVEHKAIFHETKQSAFDLAKGEWILQMDADERVSSQLAAEIKEVISLSGSDLREWQKKQEKKNKKLTRLFKRHQKLLEKRDGRVGTNKGETVAFFIPRVNMFLGKPLLHAGVYPDGVIRLVRKGYAHFPAKNVHEQTEVNGKVGWLYSNLLHHDSPTLKKYFARLNYYTTLHAKQLADKKAPKTLLYFIYYCFGKTAVVFLSLYFRHKGFRDGPRGFLWSFFSASHYPIAYFKYITSSKLEA